MITMLKFNYFEVFNMKKLLSVAFAFCLLTDASYALAPLPITDVDVGVFAINAHRQMTNLDFARIDRELDGTKDLFEGQKFFDRFKEAYLLSGNYDAIRNNLFVVSSTQSGAKAERLDGGVWKVSFESHIAFTGAQTRIEQCVDVEMHLQQRGGPNSTDFGVLNQVGTPADCGS